VDKPSEFSEYTTEEDNISGSSSNRNELDDGETDDDKNYETFENYASSDYKLFQDPPDLGSIIDN
ncbi:10671_t:CDS:1, partial [Funneliformis geosporum]